MNRKSTLASVSLAVVTLLAYSGCTKKEPTPATETQGTTQEQAQPSTPVEQGQTQPTAVVQPPGGGQQMKIEEMKQGTGKEATTGKTVSVHYTGWLASNNKEFDSSRARGPFQFQLGAGQVIQGWDKGVVGMKIGGKRKLVIPPEMAYGERGAGGVIPPNSTLVFEVELLDVK